ncbi:hypothetical protein BLNAU_19097 [Blattamonas nauphoetae]|uniref:Uncharacterized protein n=1 Tax=Blattamonas nauphoetae TaxID=2049346 RepID=A0ABQ9X2F2_9EUKA|nr:hypothetical protein BLNAU_19097 [Blattamonas nauphoetae]
MFTKTIPLRIIATPKEERVRTVRIPRPDTIRGLYSALANALKVEPQDLTLLFPSIPPRDTNVRKPSPGTTRSGIVTANANDVDGTRWKSLVGESGCKYTFDVKVDKLLNCWPTLDDGSGMAPITVISLSKGFCSQIHINDLELRRTLKKLDMMFQLYYTKPEQRCIKLPATERYSVKEHTVYVRECWDVFARGIIQKITKMYKLTPSTQHPNPNFPLLPENEDQPDRLTQEEIDAVPPDLFHSIRQAPDWIETTQLMERFERRLSEDDDIRHVFLNGQPGTGKSQMLIGEIHPLVVPFLGASGEYIPNPADREQASVMMNVIDVFGLTQRILGSFVGGEFIDLRKALKFWNFLPSLHFNEMPVAPLTFVEGNDKPISLFATRLLAALNTLESAHCLEIMHNRELEEGLRERMLKLKVNVELLISHAEFTVYSAMPNQSTLRRTQNTCNTVLIDAIRDKIASQQNVEREVIVVFFIWIVLAEHVSSFRNVMPREDLSTHLPFNTGVVSVSDLLPTESSDCRDIREIDIVGLREMRQFYVTSAEFIDCFKGPAFRSPLPTLDNSIVCDPASTTSSNLSEFVASLENKHLSNLQPSSVQSGQFSCF